MNHSLHDRQSCSRFQYKKQEEKKRKLVIYEIETERKRGRDQYRQKKSDNKRVLGFDGKGYARGQRVRMPCIHWP